eukprot:UN22657
MIKLNTFCLAIAGVFVANALWGTNATFMQISLQSISPMFFTCVRFALVACCMVPASYKLEKESWSLIPRSFSDSRLRPFLRDFIPFGISSAVGSTFYVFGCVLAGSFVASMWQAIQPFTALGLAACLGLERVTMFKLIGCVLVFSGVAFKSIMSNSSTSTGVNDELL